MRQLIVVLAACGSAPDHELHDRSTSDASGTHYRLDGTAVDVRTIPQVSGWLGLPVSGTADVAIDIDIPHRDLRKATGTIELRCTGCQLGDDTAKLVLDDQASRDFTGGGIQFGHVAIDAFAIKVKVGGGKARVESWTFRSGDLAVEVEFEAELASSWDTSAVAGCIRFKVDKALERRDPKTAAMFELTGAALGDDGFFHVALEGSAGSMRKLAKVCSP